MCPFGQLFALAVPAARAVLRGVGGVHRDDPTTGALSLVCQIGDELPPYTRAKAAGLYGLYSGWACHMRIEQQ